ncbi:MAG: sigma-70 family RNA polymerase sigma factor [Candidatus Aminicenantes bacterium]|jgi:RNA polymerase sigma-70 factor (ECF subfamily)|nr:sigma-70 family RNA polymerase sigma factor [Candidatus Aminicenantes bacterium]
MEQKQVKLEEKEIASLVERIKQGDREAFMRLVEGYQQKVFVVTYSLVRNREDALDLVQETFLRLYEKINSFRPGENFQGWLMQIARNLSIDFLRRQMVRKKESLDELDLDREVMAGAQSDPARFNPGQMLQKAVHLLPPRQKDVFILHHYEELKYEEIARRLKISVGTVKSLHFKAMQRLKEILAPQLGGNQ